MNDNFIKVSQVWFTALSHTFVVFMSIYIQVGTNNFFTNEFLLIFTKLMR